MSLFNKAIGGFDVLSMQARSYLGPVASRARAIAKDISMRAGPGMKRYGIGGAMAGGAIGGARNYYDGGDSSSIAGGMLRGAAIGGAVGLGYKGYKGIAGSLGKGGMLRAAGSDIGAFAVSSTASMRGALSSRMAAGRLSNNMDKASRSFKMNNFV